MREGLVKIATAIVIFFSSDIHANQVYQQLNVKVNQLGSHKGNSFYINLESPFLKPCIYGVAYCKNDSDADSSCQSMLSIALAAKTSDKPLSDFRFEYDESTKICSVWLIAQGNPNH